MKQEQDFQPPLIVDGAAMDPLFDGINGTWCGSLGLQSKPW
jgi:hypothetical protein